MPSAETFAVNTSLCLHSSLSLFFLSEAHPLSFLSDVVSIFSVSQSPLFSSPFIITGRGVTVPAWQTIPSWLATGLHQGE